MKKLFLLSLIFFCVPAFANDEIKDKSILCFISDNKFIGLSYAMTVLGAIYAYARNNIK